MITWSKWHTINFSCAYLGHAVRAVVVCTMYCLRLRQEQVQGNAPSLHADSAEAAPHSLNTLVCSHYVAQLLCQHIRTACSVTHMASRGLSHHHSLYIPNPQNRAQAHREARLAQQDAKRQKLRQELERKEREGEKTRSEEEVARA